MPMCRTLYRLHIPEVGSINALAEEERDPDEWGNPGVLIRRRWVYAQTWDGVDVSPKLADGSYLIRGKPEPVGAIRWVDE